MELLVLIPDLDATALPTVRCLPTRGLLFASSLGHIPDPRLDWCLLDNDEMEMLPSAGVAAWHTLTVLPVAVFPSQSPGLPAAVWIPAHRLTSFHGTQKGKPRPFRGFSSLHRGLVSL